LKNSFREITELWPNINNVAIFNRTVRLFIRYITRLTGLNVSSIIFDYIADYKIKSFTSYVFKINAYRNNYFYKLQNNDLKAATEVKIRWSEYTSQYSKSSIEKNCANSFLALCVEFNATELPKLPEINTSNENSKFYIVGPNSSQKNYLKEKYKDFHFIYSKDNTKEIADNRSKLLFSNAFYYLKRIQGNSEYIEMLQEKYEECYVFSNDSEITNEFEVVRSSSQGNISSLMSLGRILYYLVKQHGYIECIIDGFDLYLSKEPYENLEYDKITRQKNNQINESEICLSLGEHDFIYNFLFLKKICNSYISLVDSDYFSSIIAMNSDQYIERLIESRNFKSLR
jgi:hypothetical protein